MRVYILEGDLDRYQDLVPIRNEDWDQFDRLNGTRLASNWSPVAVEALTDDLSKDQRMSDFPGLAIHVPVFSARAVEVLGDLLTRHGEILPLMSVAGTFFAFNVTEVADVLDEPRSEIKKLPSGRVLDIIRHEFKPDSLHAFCVFKLLQRPLGRVYVTDEFVARVKDAGLTGINFKQVWHTQA